ncbi:hypothetical protein GCM10007933_03590 [Zoogloea oryzae]|uniref:Uncharacterized protein n=1 Tax=Zoogloea oryzae TaxID=310767 RepID=A0ABQ6F898_9RHOO|nr:hypothetical protein GCM10007933_03590 [Zoogloea oryzae]
MDIVRQVKLLPHLEYRGLAGVPGSYFDCERMRAVLTPEACASNFLSSTVLGDGRYASCYRCPIGRGHAGEAGGPDPDADRGWRCCRCGPSGQSRIIGRTLCVSCYNRTKEALLQRDGRGKVPVGIMEGLRPAWAIVGEVPQPEDDDAPRTIVRPLQLSRAVLAAIPGFYHLAPGRIMMTALVESPEELQRVIRRRFPGVAVQASGVEPTLLEFHETGIDPNDWLRAPPPQKSH